MPEAPTCRRCQLEEALDSRDGDEFIDWTAVKRSFEICPPHTHTHGDER